MRLVLDWLVMIGTFGGKVLRFGAILLVENPKHMIGQLSETSVSKFGAAKLENPKYQMQISEILKNAGVVALTALSQIRGIIDSTKSGKAAVINVYSEHCGYSQQMASIYANYVPINANKNINFYGVDANTVTGATGEYGIRGVPTFIGLACGKEVDRVTGADEEGLSRLMTKLGNIQC